MGPHVEGSTQGSGPSGLKSVNHDQETHPNIVKVFSLGASTGEYEEGGRINIRGMAVTTLKFAKYVSPSMKLDQFTFTSISC
jgi:hypothetical protein